MRRHRRRGPVESPRGCGGELNDREVVDEGAVQDPRGVLQGGHGGAAGERGSLGPARAGSRRRKRMLGFRGRVGN
jgi:hypothetical protein